MSSAPSSSRTSYRSWWLFYLHEVALKNKKDTVTQVSNDVENVPQSYIRNELASPVSNDNVTQNKASVNNTDTKFLLDVDRFSND